MRKSRSAVKAQENVLDTASTKRRRGRTPKVHGLTLRGRSDNYRGILSTVWCRLSPALLEAQSDDDVVKVFQTVLAGGNEFSPQAALILRILNDPNFPKRQREIGRAHV